MCQQRRGHRREAVADDEGIRMPRLGESIVEATLTRWRVAEGDHVEAGEVVAEVETDKATNDIPAPRSGRVGSLLVAEGATVDVGVLILSYADAPRPEAISPEPTATSRSVTAGASRESRLAPRPVGADGTPRPTSPAVRRAARLHGVDLAEVAGTGRRGRITRDDLGRALGSPDQSAPASPARTPENPADEVLQLSGRRKRIADNLARAQRETVGVFALTEIDLARVDRARALYRDQGVRLSYVPFLLQAILRALDVHPEMNATLLGATLTRHQDRNVGVAVDTEDGLIVPVVKRADRLSLTGLADEVRQLAERARRRALRAEDLDGGTFTLSNPGRDGNLVGVSILRAPEVGILRTGAVVRRPVVRVVDDEEHIVIRPVMMAALTYDHRAIDGRTGNRFLTAIRSVLEHWEPENLSGRPFAPGENHY